MALESTTCGTVHHARRTRAHCPTMVSSFKLSSGTVCLLGFSCRAGHIRKGKYKICGSYQVQDCTGRNGIVHHARRTRAHCPTMISSFKLSSGTVCLLGFSCRAGHIRKGKYKICGGSYHAQCHRWYSLVPSVPNSIYYSIWSYSVRDAQCRSLLVQSCTW